MAENQLKKNNSRQDQLEMLRAMQKKLIMRAVLIVAVVLLTGISFFALTAAWYTNIVGTDGLFFGAKQWNFEGSVEVGDAPVNAAPGDSGIIPITISNQGTEMAVASITTSKAGFMPEDMKQRIYFYVDAPMYRNEERMERVYVSAYSSYTYTLFPQSSLVLTEKQQDSHPLHWQWVYDVVGYYVMGRKDVSGNVTVEEYIRPIEYDFDIFTTTFDQDGNLLTVDGTKTAKEFLEEVSAADGYAGIIDASQRPSGGYYPVSVKDGYGVWAYLCTYEQIQANAAFDTKVGTGDYGQMQCPVEVTVTGSNSNGGAVEVSNAETLAAILTTSTHASVKLTEDIQLPATITMAEGSRVEIDLNGKTLTSTQNVAFNVPEGAKLTINGGTDLNNPGVIEGSGAEDSVGIYAAGAEVELNNVRITKVQDGIQVRDYLSSNNTDSVIRIVDSTVIAERMGLFLFGNSGEGDTPTTVVVENSRISGNGYIGVYCNGSYPNLNVTITGSEITGYWGGVYFPAVESTLTLRDCTITGTNDAGVIVKGGVVNIEDCRIFAHGKYAAPKVDPNGFADSGAGVYIEASYNWNVIVNISGDTIVSSKNGEAIRLVEAENYTYDAKFVISGGKFTSAATADQSAEEGALQIDGSIPEGYLAEGCTAQELVDEDTMTTTYTVTRTP